MDFGNILSRSWQIVWKNKYLFVFGFLAVLGSCNGGANNSNFSFGSREAQLSPGDVERFFNNFGPVILGLSCLFIIIFIVLWLVRLVAQASLISAAARIDAGEKVSFGEAFSAGTGMLGRMVGINLIMYGPFTLIGLIAAVVALITAGGAIITELSGTSPGDFEAIFTSLGIILFCFVCLACLMVPLMIFISAIYPFAQRGAVLNDLGVVDSIRHGWKVLKSNLGDIILLGILFVVIGFLFGFISFIVLIPFAFLALGPAFFNIITNNTVNPGDILLMAGGGVCVGLVAAVVNSIMIAFRSTAVTLAYQEFMNKES